MCGCFVTLSHSISRPYFPFFQCGKTEKIDNNHNPQFRDTVVVQSRAADHLNTQLKLVLYDVDGDRVTDRDIMGFVYTTIGAVCGNMQNGMGATNGAAQGMRWVLGTANKTLKTSSL
jgi:hypothetical protein